LTGPGGGALFAVKHFTHLTVKSSTLDNRTLPAEGARPYAFALGQYKGVER
jgi:hypothetical protein